MSASAETLLRDLSARGVRLTRNADRLHVEAPRGTLTPELRETLVEAKPAILAALTAGDLRTKLANLAHAEGIDGALVDELPAAGVESCAGLPDHVLRAYVRALRDSDLRERGTIPSDETAPAICRGCGPVWLAPEVAAVAPIVRGRPYVLGCPWCHVSNRRAIPRPPVTCGGCAHLVRDAVNPIAGMGRCGVARAQQPSEPLPYPFATRTCAEWRPTSQEEI